MLPPSCFTVGMILCRQWAVPGFLQTQLLELRRNSSTLVFHSLRVLRCVFLTPSRLQILELCSDLCPSESFSTQNQLSHVCVVVPNFSRLRIMEALVLLGTSNGGQLFKSLLQICAWTKSCLSSAGTSPHLTFTSCLGFCADMQSAAVRLSKSYPIKLIYYRWTPIKVYKHLKDDEEIWEAQRAWILMSMWYFIFLMNAQTFLKFCYHFVVMEYRV